MFFSSGGCQNRVAEWGSGTNHTVICFEKRASALGWGEKFDRGTTEVGALFQKAVKPIWRQEIEHEP